MQMLYQFDARGSDDADRDDVAAGMEDGPDDTSTIEAALDVSHHAWNQREESDKLVADLAPQWPTHRQPPVDRAILRLAVWEMRTGYSPARVAITEAIELAKTFSTEQSPPFINGVLDRVAHGLVERGEIKDLGAAPAPEGDPAASSNATAGEAPKRPVVADPWLNDALKAGSLDEKKA